MKTARKRRAHKPAKKRATTKPQAKAPDARPRINISDALLALSRGKKRRSEKPFNAFQSDPRELHPPQAIGGKAMAMDEAIGGSLAWAYASLPFSEGIGFMGYAYLAELTQRPEYRRITERLATEMTRKWVKLKSTGKTNNTEKIKAIEAEMVRLGVQACFKEVAEHDGFFGRGHIYIDLGKDEDREELKTPIGDGRDKISQAKIGKGSLKRLKPVEPVWCYPSNYNSNDPIRPDWYKPSMWIVQGKEIHASRLLTFIGREVPDILKPAYSFGGLSLSQMAKPYVDNWLQTRQSVSDIISAFSVFVLSTNMAEVINTSPEQIFNRADFFNNLRDNRGLMMIDKAIEEFKNVSAPLGTLDMLQAQSQEHMASVSGIPLIVLLGIQPAGLNATSEGELRAFYEWVNAYQVAFFTANLTRVIDFIQLSLYGATDPDITFEYEPLASLDRKQQAEVKSTEADTDAKYVEAGVVSAYEVRGRLASDPTSPYSSLSLETNDVPPPPEPESEEEPTS